MGYSAGGLCGKTAISCNDAASATPVPQTCGLTRIPNAFAMSAIFLHSEIPPAAQVSGGKISTARSTRAEPPARKFGLTTSDRHRKGGLHLPITAEILRRYRLFEPADVKFFNPPAELDRGNSVIGMVGVDHDPDPIADRLTHRLAQTYIFVNAEAELQLDRRESSRDPLLRFGQQVVHRVAVALAVKAGGVGLDPFAQWPAEEPVDWQAEMAGFQIPKRDVDSAQRLDRQALLAVIA